MSNIFQKQFVDLLHPNHKDFFVDKLAQDGLVTEGLGDFCKCFRAYWSQETS